MKILIIVIRVNPVDGIVKNFAAKNVIGNMAKPNNKNTSSVRPNSAGDDHPSSWNAANVATNRMVVIKYVK